MLANVFDITSCFRLSPPWGGRPACCCGRTRSRHFNPRPPWGRATAKTYKYATLCLYIVHIKLYIFATAVLFT